MKIKIPQEVQDFLIGNIPEKIDAVQESENPKLQELRNWIRNYSEVDVLDGLILEILCSVIARVRESVIKELSMAGKDGHNPFTDRHARVCAARSLFSIANGLVINSLNGD
jgi:hypothetical protein